MSRFGTSFARASELSKKRGGRGERPAADTLGTEQPDV
jgi:hypothetical protein